VQHLVGLGAVVAHDVGAALAQQLGGHAVQLRVGGDQREDRQPAGRRDRHLDREVAVGADEVADDELRLLHLFEHLRADAQGGPGGSDVGPVAELREHGGDAHVAPAPPAAVAV
jgi:hypothetical protein